MKLKGILLLLFACILNYTHAQTGGTIRGNVYDEDTGEPVIYGNVLLEGTNYGANTDFDGFFSIGNLPAGDYTLKLT